jgi:hypothetical protein
MALIKAIFKGEIWWINALLTVPKNRIFGVPTGIRTRVASVKGRCPRPLDDGDLRISLLITSAVFYYKTTTKTKLFWWR